LAGDLDFFFFFGFSSLPNHGMRSAQYNFIAFQNEAPISSDDEEDGGKDVIVDGCQSKSKSMPRSLRSPLQPEPTTTTTNHCPLPPY